MITLKELAKRLNLSTATVSRALHDSHEISTETKSRVLAMAKELNYQPNPFASSLRKRVSKTIAVVLPEVADSFFSLAINGIESVALDKGYHVLIYLSHESFEREKAIMNEFKTGRVDGLLISVSQDTTSGKHINEIMDSGVPVVFFDRVCEDVVTTKVITNDYECGRQATLHLADQGCKHIIYLCINPLLQISSERKRGYRAALKERNLPYLDSDILVCEDNLEENTKTLVKLLKKKSRPDGLIASVEKMTTPVYLACHQLGLKIPEQVKLVGFTNLQAALILQPTLTTITQPAYQMGAEAAQMLFRKIEKKSQRNNSETRVIPSLLVPRGSTRGK